MSAWTTVEKKKNKVKKKNIYYDTPIIKNNIKNNIKKKQKLNNYINEKILKYCEIKTNDYEIFHSWKHFYIMGNIKKNNTIFRLENKLLLLKYFNKFKIYKNYNKGDNTIFINILKNIKMTPKRLYLEMLDNNLFYKNTLLQEHSLFKPIYQNFYKIDIDTQHNIDVKERTPGVTENKLLSTVGNLPSTIGNLRSTQRVTSKSLTVGNLPSTIGNLRTTQRVTSKSLTIGNLPSTHIKPNISFKEMLKKNI